MKKRVYIAWHHQQVIKEWFRYREQGSHVLSFDYHTDFHEAFISKAGETGLCHSYSRDLHNSYLRKHIPCEDVAVAISDLKNDEHIDFAIRSGIIKKAFVFSHEQYSRTSRVFEVPTLVECTEQSIEDESIQKLFQRLCPTVLKDADKHKEDILYEDTVENSIISFPEYKHSLLPVNDELKTAKLVATDEILREVIDAFCKYGFNLNNYILDFDCDFITNSEAMSQDHFKLLTKLIKDAKAVTIARSADYVYECSRHTLTYDVVESWLVDLIRKCDDNIEIEAEL